ncbi:hypothetical protein [Salipiger sp. PrR003]|uniref:hypothetical protein n=1 Tax=Salipiger sp. PrR003 TaxID=2706776 RepID=UPI0013DC968F|nr:hypothetical protein [Salipiger sp. PrR003]NDV50753.1 hypothetical protein [Salipiger sp. PrR003]
MNTIYVNRFPVPADAVVGKPSAVICDSFSFTINDAGWMVRLERGLMRSRLEAFSQSNADKIEMTSGSYLDCCRRLLEAHSSLTTLHFESKERQAKEDAEKAKREKASVAIQQVAANGRYRNRAKKVMGSIFVICMLSAAGYSSFSSYFKESVSLVTAVPPSASISDHKTPSSMSISNTVVSPEKMKDYLDELEPVSAAPRYEAPIPEDVVTETAPAPAAIPDEDLLSRFYSSDEIRMKPRDALKDNALVAWQRGLDEHGISNIPHPESYVANRDHVETPVPGGGTIKSLGDLAEFGLMAVTAP